MNASDGDSASTSTTDGEPTASTSTGEEPTTISASSPSTTSLGSTTDATTTDNTTTDDTTTQASEGTSGASTQGDDLCGDGVLDPGEECDLGEEKNGVGEHNGCNDDCTLQPSCGDGKLQALYEECDPNDPLLVEAAICSDVCTWDGVIIFVTSETYSGKLGGFSGADTKCQQLADAAGLQFSEKYRAWLSIGDKTAASRVPQVNTPYYRLDGMTLADNYTDLISGKLDQPLLVTEKKTEVQPSMVWTNTTANGQTASDDDCQSFSSENLKDTSHGGFTDVTDHEWTLAGGSFACDWNARIYCFSAPFPPEP